MYSLLELTVWVHASLGAICLISGTVALLSPKKKGRHPLAGKIFVISMVLVVLMILPNMIVKTNIFLTALGWLAIYTSVDGWRALLRFRQRLGPDPTMADYAINGITVVLSLVLIGYGGWVFLGSEVFGGKGPALMALVVIGFGLLGLMLATAALKRKNQELERQDWLILHISRMCGAFGAALTAFFAIQLSGHIGGFEWIVWVAPSVVMAMYSKRELKARNLIPRSEPEASEPGAPRP